MKFMHKRDAQLSIQMMHARWIVAAILALLGSCLSTGCATSPADAPPAKSPGVGITPQPRPGAPELASLRAEIDAAGRGADCTPFAASTGARAWLGAWCGYRTAQWRQSARDAQIARDYFAARGSLRRQIEMLLLEAIAREELARGDLAPQQSAHATRSYAPRAQTLARHAHRLWLSARLPLHGGLRDANAGDLASLLAQSLHLGLLPNATTPEGAPLRRSALLDIARHEYRDVGRFGALSHTLRTSHRLAMERGELDLAIEMLERAFALDLASGRKDALDEDLALFGALGVFLGQTEAPDPAERALSNASSTLSSTPSTESFLHLLAHAAGRRQLADYIAWTRSSPGRAIAPPPALMEALHADIDFSTWHGEDWRLGFQGGQLLAEHGRFEPAKRFLRASIAAIEQMRARLATPTLRQEFFADKRKVYMALVDAYIGVGTTQRTQADYQRSLLLANALKARGLLDLLDGHLDPALATEARPSRRGGTKSRSASPASRPTRRARATRARTTLQEWSSPPSATPARGSGAPRAQVSTFAGLPGALVAKIPADAVLLEYLIMPRRSYLWVISDQGIKMRQVAGREDIEALVQAFLGTLRHPSSANRQRALAERLYVELIGPAQDLLKSVERVIIAPDGVLYDLPFELLARPTPGPTPDYMLHNQVVTYTPSSAVFERLTRRDVAHQPPTQPTPALLIGAADLDRAAIDLLKLATDLPASGMYSLHQIFPPLPGARAELAAIHTRLGAREFDVEMRVGEMAAESWLRNADLSRYGIIHVATHGVSDARSLQVAGVQSELAFKQPALLLSKDPEQPDDGILTLSELLSRRTAAQVVVLSGCTTGRGWRTLGAGAFGLAGAMLYTGSRNVVASMWSVEDRDTAKLMAAFYRGIAGGKTPAQALRSGQIAMAKAGMSPASWAAFRVIGGE